MLYIQGGAKAQEAAYIYDELIDKYGSSPSLLNGLAVARMHLQQWDEAEGTLKEAITKVATTPHTIFIMKGYFLQNAHYPALSIE